MTKHSNSLGQPIGFPIESWQSAVHPQGSVMEGRLCRLMPIDIASHARDLFEAFSLDANQHNWTYLPYGPFEQLEDCKDWLETTCSSDDPCFFSVIDLSSGKAIGVASYLRSRIAQGSVVFRRPPLGLRARTTRVRPCRIQSMGPRPQSG